MALYLPSKTSRRIVTLLEAEEAMTHRSNIAARLCFVAYTSLAYINRLRDQRCLPPEGVMGCLLRSLRLLVSSASPILSSRTLGHDNSISSWLEGVMGEHLHMSPHRDERTHHSSAWILLAPGIIVALFNALLYARKSLGTRDKSRSNEF